MTLVNLKECYRKQRCAEISTTLHDLSLISKVQDEKKSTLLAFPFFFFPSKYQVFCQEFLIYLFENKVL